MTAYTPHNKPRYTEVGALEGLADQAACPPFLFREVTSRVFPIRANMARLSTFCDQYLNLDIPDTLVQFRPSVPYVYLMVINYGSMAAESVRAQNFGWVAQREITFTIPLERWVRDAATDEWRFVNWACVSPFIFVDDPMSLGTGREVYGWPKVAAQVDADVPLWARDPRAPTRLFSLRTPIFPRLYHAAREELRVLLQIDRDSVPRFSEFPPDLDNPWNPAAMLSSAARNAFGLMGQAADLMLRSRARGYRQGWTPATMAMMSRAAARNLVGLMPSGGEMLPGRVRGLLHRLTEPTDPSNDPDRPRAGGLGIDMITLKQFRDSDDPTQACYQALVRSRMTVERINRCGLLGDYNLLRGDPSGGYSVRIHCYPAQPVIDCLGLEVARTESGDDAPIAILRPVFPFWTDVDLHYGVGETLCWRAQCAHHSGHCTGWHHGGAPEANSLTTRLEPASEPAQRIPYNTLQGAATQAVAGPFEFTDVTLQIYPLPAEQRVLRRFVERYLNQTLAEGATPETPYRHRFEAFGSRVYLLIACPGEAGSMWSETNDLGCWADKDLSFCVPVRHYQRTAGDASGWECQGIGMLAPFVFSNSSRAVISDREINGRPSIQACITSPDDPWLDAAGPIAKRHLLHVATELFPAFFMGQRAEHDTLLELCECSSGDRTSPPKPAAKGAGRRQADAAEHRSRLHRWLLSQGPVFDAGRSHDATLTVSRFHLKQYRDASQAEHACYQALVETQRHLTAIRESGSIPQPLEVRLALTPAYPITRILGLKLTAVEATPDGVMQILTPQQPFWLRGAVREELGHTLCWRTAQGPWSPTDTHCDARRGAPSR